MLSAVVAALSIRLGIMGEGGVVLGEEERGRGGSGIALSEEAAPFLGKPELPLKPPILSERCMSRWEGGGRGSFYQKKSPSILLLS